jgi:hypothetical protein
LSRIFGAEALIPPKNAPSRIARKFSLRALESIAAGIARNKAKILELDNPDGFIRDKVHQFWHQPEVAEMSSPGLRGSLRIMRTVPFGSKWFKPHGQA